MRWVFPRSRELELAWKMGAGILVGSLILSPFGMLIFISKYIWSFTMVRPPSSTAPFAVTLADCPCSMSLVALVVLRDPRVRCRFTTASATPPNLRSDRHRLLLPACSRLLPGLLYSQLD